MPFLNQNVNRNIGNTNQQRSTITPPWMRNNNDANPNHSNTSSMSWTPKPNIRNFPNGRNNPSTFGRPELRNQNQATIPIESSRYTQNSQPSFQTQEKFIPIRLESSNTPSQFNRFESQQHQPKSQCQSQTAPSQPPWRKERAPSQNAWQCTPPVIDHQKMQITPTLPPSGAATNFAQSQPVAPVKCLQPSQMITRIPPQPTIAAVPRPPPMAPKMPPTAPILSPPPPPPSINSATPSEPFVRKPMTKEKALKLAALRSRPRGRPDWSDMMKEVESVRKLRHVQCNDRSAPILPQMKAKGQFVYESEKKDDNVRNKLLKDIQTGVKLRKVKCNDRSKPNLDGLRKFKTELSMDDQIKKCVSMADVVAAATEPDDLDDIDKVREDLQSAKQMLALEIRSKEALEREIKRLLARVANLETELEKEKSLRSSHGHQGRPIRTEEDERLMMQLKYHASEADRTIKDLEHKYHTTAEQLDNMKRKLESSWLRNQELEQQLRSVSHGTPVNQLIRQPSKKFIPISNGASIDLISDDESESEAREITNESKEEKIAKELKVLTTKLRIFREKQAASMKERRILREELKKKQKEMKDEKKKYNLLQKEVDKMARLMRNQRYIDYEHEQCQQLDEDTESESSEESEEEGNSDREMPQTATSEQKRQFLLERTKRRENRLSTLKKGNDLMKANIERLIEDVNKQREMSLALQEELNHILTSCG